MRHSAAPPSKRKPAVMHCQKVHANPAVYLVRVPFENHKLDSTNCYVVVDDGEALVVDTGAPSPEGPAFWAAAFDELGVDARQASFFLTHLHFDHAGLVDQIVAPDAPIYLNRQDYQRTQPAEAKHRFTLLHRALVAEGADVDSARCAIESRSQFTHIIQKEHRLKFVKEGDPIRVGGHTFRVVDTAGHTPGHQGLYDPESGILFGGDHVLFIMSSGLGLFLPEGDALLTYLANLEKVRALGVRTLLHSHGPLRKDVNERIDQLRDHQLRRAERVASIVREQPGLTGFEITQRIGFNLPFATWDDIPCVQRLTVMELGAVFLRHLEERGAVKVKLDDAGARRYWPQ